MDNKCINAFRELSTMQSKIATLFQDLLREKNECKLNSENLSNYVDKLFSEMSDLKKQNNILKQNNEELRALIYKCIHFCGNLDLKKHSKDHELIFESIKRSYLNIFNQSKYITSIGGSNNVGIEVDSLEDKKECCNRLSGSRSELDEETIKQEIESIQQINLPSHFVTDSEINLNLRENQWLCQRSKSERILENRKSFINHFQNINEGFVLVPDSDALLSHKTMIELQVPETAPPLEEPTIIQDYAMNTPKKTMKTPQASRSPVFKDLGNRRQDNLSPEGNTIEVQKTSPLKLVNEKFLLKTADLLVSPLKRSSTQADSTSPKLESSTKRSRRGEKSHSPRRSPSSQLKKSNSREAEVSISGVRKLTQTLLNIELFKKSPKKKGVCSNRENENSENSFDNKNIHTLQVSIEGDEDDVIMESPKLGEDVTEMKKEQRTNVDPLPDEVRCLTPASSSAGVDLDETFVSSSVIKKSRMTENNLLEPVCEETTPLKRLTRDRSPEYDSVPYMYRRDAVRKKSERMKLPGHTCLECKKYYQNVFGEDVDSQKLKAVLNKCSRHRDKYSSKVNDTPPGYWKPYLTCSTMQSPNKDDTIMG